MQDNLDTRKLEKIAYMETEARCEDGTWVKMVHKINKSETLTPEMPMVHRRGK